MTDRERTTEPAPPPEPMVDPDGVTPTTRHKLLWEALAGIQRIERMLERVADQLLEHDAILKRLPCYTVDITAPDTKRANGGD